MGVKYADIDGFPGYRVGTDGSVWSCWSRISLGYKKGVDFVLTDDWCRLKQGYVHGYRRVSLYRGRRAHYFRVHRLVLAAFRGPCPVGMEGCHNDNDKTNNALSNLRWDTRKSNQADRVDHGTHLRGERHPRAKLTAKLVLKVVSDFRSGRSRDEIVNTTQLPRDAVNRILIGKSWGSVTGIKYARKRGPYRKRRDT